MKEGDVAAHPKQGFSVRIFIPDGEPEGLKIVEKSNWTGQGIVFPRSLFADTRQRPELKRTGVYVLWGPSESGQLPRVYIGEGDEVLSRLDQHAKTKDFWTHGAAFTSKDQNLNKAHVQHIESRLLNLASEAKRCEIDNGNMPNPPSLSEADAADAEGFLADVLLCLPVVGVSLFERAKAPGPRSRDLFLKAKGVEARKGLLSDDGSMLRLTQDYTFASPSTAAGVLLGRSSNGRTEWKDVKGRTLKEIQEAETSEG
jgi:hypothetical protein